MTLQEFISTYDEDRKNTESVSNKSRWVRELETTIMQDIVSRYENDLDEEHYFEDWGMQKELIVDIPYTDVYTHYIDMKLGLKLNQSKMYNNAQTLFNNTYLTFQQFYNRTHKPKDYKRNWFNHTRRL